VEISSDGEEIWVGGQCVTVVTGDVVVDDIEA